MAGSLFRDARAKASDAAFQQLQRAALLHETGFSVSHTGFHKHGAYILRNADMPGFSAGSRNVFHGSCWAVAADSRNRGDARRYEFRAQLCALRPPCCSITRAGRYRRRA
jgi:hypothetical protein